ncbi:hypothetical protein ACRQ5D_34325 [Mucilaginibacter sp. P25]|uniref:hypothetical protein n=1 Tax=Mucilaginibacter sp. P25 TaxID=3423945 RepID=UPI003D78E0EB
MSILLDTHDEYTKKGMPEISLEMLDQFNKLKESWVAISERWLGLTTGKSSNESINKWYLQELLKEVRRERD